MCAWSSVTHRKRSQILAFTGVTSRFRIVAEPRCSTDVRLSPANGMRKSSGSLTLGKPPKKPVNLEQQATVEIIRVDVIPRKEVPPRGSTAADDLNSKCGF